MIGNARRIEKNLIVLSADDGVKEETPKKCSVFLVDGLLSKTKTFFIKGKRDEKNMNHKGLEGEGIW